MIRFDLVIANRNRSEIFWESWKSLKNFDKKKDRLIFLDCSDDSSSELRKCQKAIRGLKLQKINFYFFKRRNWHVNHGAQLDYIRLIGEEILERPQFTYFMQDHYLNKNKFVKGDTIPQENIVDLNEIYKILIKNNKTVVFYSRNGFRISAVNPEIENNDKSKDINLTHLKGAEDICFVIDGGNFCLDVKYYLNHYREYKWLYTYGNGSYYSSHVWETRLCKILYDQNLIFYEKHRNLKFTTVAQLKSKYPDPGNIWGYFYHLPEAYYFYGRDIYKYNFKFNLRYREELFRWIYYYFKHDRNRTIKLLYSTLYE